MSDPYYPAGAIENGRLSLERLETRYCFTESEGHALHMTTDWACLKHAFEYMASYLETRKMDNPLDNIWYEINALGGLPSTPHDEGYCKAIGHALAIIEEHGGVDPLSRRRDNGPFGVGA